MSSSAGGTLSRETSSPALWPWRQTSGSNLDPSLRALISRRRRAGLVVRSRIAPPDRSRRCGGRRPGAPIASTPGRPAAPRSKWRFPGGLEPPSDASTPSVRDLFRSHRRAASACPSASALSHPDWTLLCAGPDGGERDTSFGLSQQDGYDNRVDRMTGGRTLMKEMSLRPELQVPRRRGWYRRRLAAARTRSAHGPLAWRRAVSARLFPRPFVPFGITLRAWLGRPRRALYARQSRSISGLSSAPRLSFRPRRTRSPSPPSLP
jgi:hypothetical protein